MKRGTALPVVVVAAIALVGLAAPAGVGVGVALAAPVPILNPGFEEVSVVLRPGEQTSGAGGGADGLPVTPVSTRWQYPFSQVAQDPQDGVLVRGWRSQNPDFGGLAGVLNPTLTWNVGGVETAWMSGFSGNNVGVAQAAFLQQTLATQVQANTTYTLSFLAGIGVTDSDYTPLIQLLAAPDLETFVRPGMPGVEFLGRYEGPGFVREQFGRMHQLSFAATTPAILPANLQNKYLAICFLGSDGIPRMCYDNFELDAVTVPAPASAGVLMVAGFVGMRRRR